MISIYILLLLVALAIHTVIVVRLLLIILKETKKPKKIYTLTVGDLMLSISQCDLDRVEKIGKQNWMKELTDMLNEKICKESEKLNKSYE